MKAQEELETKGKEFIHNFSWLCSPDKIPADVMLSGVQTFIKVDIFNIWHF
jgi:hypothetical protein